MHRVDFGAHLYHRDLTVKAPVPPEKTAARRAAPSRQRTPGKKRAAPSSVKRASVRAPRPAAASRKAAAKPPTDVWHYPAVVRSLLDGASLGIFIVLNGRVVYANSSVARMLGQQRADVGLNQDSMNWVAPEDMERVRAIRDARER